MNTRELAGIIVFSALVICSSFAADTNTIPHTFKTAIGGFLGTTYSVELRDGILHYSAVNGKKTNQAAAIVPSPQQWQGFRRSLDEIGVWRWRTNYPGPPDIYDGTQWFLEIRYPDRFLKAEGDNNYPSRRGRPSAGLATTKEFSAYAAAVSKLLGGKEFR